MYSPTVLAHLEQPRNAGAMEDATSRGEATNPVCGDLLHLYLKLDGGRIVAASFQAQACPPSIAAASVLTGMIEGLTPAQAHNLAPGDVTRALDYLPRNKQHCSVLAIDALRSALAAIPIEML